MREENVAAIRRFGGWLAAGREEAGKFAEEMLALSPAEWDEWLTAHPAARTLHTLQALLDATDGARALPVFEFVLRSVNAFDAPPEAEIARTILRGNAWKAWGDALHRTGDARAALRAYERAAAAFRSEGAEFPQLPAVERAAVAVRQELGEIPFGDDERLFEPLEPPAETDTTGIAARLLRATPYAEWPQLAQREELRNVGGLEQLRREILARAYRFPLESLAIAELAVRIADALPPAMYPEVALAQLRGQAWRDQGVALRLLARYEPALSSLDRAEEIVAPYQALAHDRAVIQLARLPALQEVNRLDEAMSVLGECKRTLAQSSDRRRQLLCGIAEGTLLHHMARFREACRAYLAVLPDARDLGDLDALASIHSNIAHAAIETGDFALAEEHLGEAVRLFEQLGELLHVARAEIARGRMLVRKGDVDAGIDHLHRVRAQFLNENLVEEAGLCGLDIIEAHLSRGAHIEAEAFARQVVREFTAAGLNARAITALDYLSEAIAIRKASGTTVQDVRRFIRALRNNPGSDFVATG